MGAGARMLVSRRRRRPKLIHSSFTRRRNLMFIKKLDMRVGSQPTLNKTPLRLCRRRGIVSNFASHSHSWGRWARVACHAPCPIRRGNQSCRARALKKSYCDRVYLFCRRRQLPLHRSHKWRLSLRDCDCTLRRALMSYFDKQRHKSRC
jgi:hypothetical protein